MDQLSIERLADRIFEKTNKLSSYLRQLDYLKDKTKLQIVVDKHTCSARDIVEIIKSLNEVQIERFINPLFQEYPDNHLLIKIFPELSTRFVEQLIEKCHQNKNWWCDKTFEMILIHSLSLSSDDFANLVEHIIKSNGTYQYTLEQFKILTSKIETYQMQDVIKSIEIPLRNGWKKDRNICTPKNIICLYISLSLLVSERLKNDDALNEAFKLCIDISDQSSSSIDDFSIATVKLLKSHLSKLSMMQKMTLVKIALRCADGYEDNPTHDFLVSIADNALCNQMFPLMISTKYRSLFCKVETINAWYAYINEEEHLDLIDTSEFIKSCSESLTQLASTRNVI